MQHPSRVKPKMIDAMDTGTALAVTNASRGENTYFCSEVHCGISVQKSTTSSGIPTDRQ